MMTSAAAQNRSPIIPGSGNPRSVLHTPTAGAIVEKIDIAIPPGRKNVQPRLALTYSSIGDLRDLGIKAERRLPLQAFIEKRDAARKAVQKRKGSTSEDYR